jgi:hypothetical protein
VSAYLFGALSVLAWFLLVLRDQYHVERLQPYEFSLDVLFVAGVAGVLLAIAVRRRGMVVLFRTLFLVFMTALALVGAEYAARWEFRHAQSSGNARDFIAHQAAAGQHEQSNTLGFRERDIPPKSPDRYRIVVIGDSFAYGQGVEEDERFSNLMEKFLGARYEVFNFGRRGNNMPEHLQVLEQALSVSPDFVLLQLYVNDWETRNMRRPTSFPLLPESIEGELVEKSLLYDLVNGQWARLQQMLGLSESYEHYMERSLRDPNSPDSQLAFGQLREFFERARAAGVPAGAVLFPAIDALGPNGKTYPFGYLHDGVHHLCADEKVTCLDLLAMFSTFKDPRALWVSPFDAHPNAVAHKRAAFEIQQTFGPVWQH